MFVCTHSEEILFSHQALSLFLGAPILHQTVNTIVEMVQYFVAFVATKFRGGKGINFLYVTVFTLVHRRRRTWF